MSPPAGDPPARQGLAGRLGQRRAVRITAVALGLLALVLGLRDAEQEDPVSSPPLTQQPSPDPSAGGVGG